MEITHEEARRLIQRNADETLNQDTRILLSAHLDGCDGCTECRVYADELNEMENTLRSVMHRQWNHRPLPLSVNALALKKSFKRKLSILLTTRTELASIAIMELIIPICGSTPTSTVNPRTLTTHAPTTDPGITPPNG